MARNDFGWVRCYKVNDGNGGKRNRYQASYLNPRNKGERINAPRRFDHKSDAHAWLAEVRKQIDAGDWRTPEEVLAERQAEDAAQRRRDMPFREFADEWFEKNVDRFRPRTKETYKGLLKRYILPFFGERPLSRITVDLVNKWYGGWRTRRRQGPILMVCSSRSSNVRVSRRSSLWNSTPVVFVVARTVA